MQARLTSTRDGSGPLVPAIPALNDGVSRSWREYLVLLPVVPIGGLILFGEAYSSNTASLLGAAAAILVAVLSPATGFACLMFLAPLKSPEVVPAPGFNALLVAAILGGCVYRLPIDRPTLRLTAPVLLLFGFILYIAAQQLPQLATGYTGNVAHLIGYYFIQMLTGLGAILAGAYVLAQRPPQPFLVAGISAALLAAFLALATFDSLAVGPRLAGLLARPDDVTRAVGPFGNPNYFGQFEATAVVAVTAWLMLARTPAARILLVALVIPLSGALVLSLSRGAAVTVFAGLIALTFMKSRRLAIVVILLAVLMVLVVYPAYINWRFGFTNAGSVEIASVLAASDGARGRAVLAGAQLFLSSPLLGVGFGQYQFATAQIANIIYGQSAHNWYMKELAEGGVIGITVWLALLAATASGLWRRPPAERLLGVGLFATFAMGSMFAEPPSSFQMSAFEVMIITAALVGVWDRGSAPSPQKANRLSSPS